MAAPEDHTPVPEIIEWRGVHAYRRCSVCGRMIDDEGLHVPENAEGPRPTREG